MARKNASMTRRLDVMQADDMTMSFTSDRRVAIVHVAGDVAIVVPSFSADGTVASRLENRVQHLKPTSFGPHPEGAAAAAEIVAAHLRR